MSITISFGHRQGELMWRLRTPASALLRHLFARSQHVRVIVYSNSAFLAAAFSSLVALAFAASTARAAPVGETFVSGAATVDRNGHNTTITQSSQNLSLRWDSFNIARAEIVRFVQPSASAIAVNRIADPGGTKIFGNLSANGQVFLINPNGIVFGRQAQVNVGGLVASTLDLNDAMLNSDARSFSGGGTGRILNRGTINALDGGYVALLGNRVSNQGSITAQLGSVALGAGNAVTLSFNGSSLVRMVVDQSVLNSLAENSGLVRANGGMVLMSAGAKNSLLASVVNSTGVIEARTVRHHEGSIVLLGGMEAGSVNVGGTLDASAPDGGNGGYIDTSAANVKIFANARVTTAASSGRSGTWLIDPVDFTISAGSGPQTVSGIGADTLSDSLNNNGSVILATSGTTGGRGDIFVNGEVNWTRNNLTLIAHRDIVINAPLRGSGTASLTFKYGQGAPAAGNTSRYIVRAPIDLPEGDNFITKLGSDGVPINWTVITKLGAEGSTTGTDLQGLAAQQYRSGNYALGAHIDATDTKNWNGNEGFDPIGGDYGVGNFGFLGRFDGLGHVITGLAINRPSAVNSVGLFASTGATSLIRNVGLSGIDIKGKFSVGGLVGVSSGLVSDSYAIGSVAGIGLGVGGLIGWSQNSVERSYAMGDVAGANTDTGGLIGVSTGTISNSYATSNVTSTGGFVGGLVGRSSGLVSDSYATGTVTGGGSGVGGLIGYSTNAVVRSHATGEVTGSDDYTGGLVGLNTSTISRSYATGKVTSTGDFGFVGGLAGYSDSTISESYATGQVNGRGDYTGGLVGYSSGQILSSFATGNVTSAGNAVGGLVGRNENATISSSYATGTVKGDQNYVGGLVGLNRNGTVNTSYSTGNVSGTAHTGGLVGGSTGAASVTDSYWDTDSSRQAFSSGGGIGLSAAQMKQKTNFINWDFTTTWLGYDSFTNPLLRAFMTPLEVTANNAVKTYDGQAYSSANGVSYSATPNSRLYGTVNFGSDKNAGTYSLTPRGLYSDQFGYIVSYTSGTLVINPATLTATVSVPNKVYDGTTAVPALTITLNGLAGNESLNTSATATFNSKDVVSANQVTVNTVSLADGANGGLASNYRLDAGQSVAANITPAQLMYTATPATAVAGNTPVNLSGVVQGLVAGDTLHNATSGIAKWTTAAGALSLPGSYAIDGSGLIASNYYFAQSPGNATALTLTPVIPLQVINPSQVDIPGKIITPEKIPSTISIAFTPRVRTEAPLAAMSGLASALKIVNGGVKLPADMISFNE